MKIRILYILLAVIICTTGTAYGQAIVKGSGVLYTNGAPTHTVNVGVDAEIAIDSSAGLWYEYNRDALAWEKAGFRVRHLPISVAPTGAPTDKQSEIVVNDVDSLYQWRSGAWRHLNRSNDPSITNEGQLGVGAGGASSSTLISNTSGSNPVTINVAGINTISETTSSNGGSITITATEVDGSVTNELQTYSHAGTTTYTNTLSNGGGSFTINAGGINTISHTAGTLTITATEVDGSVTNELQTYSHAGTTTYTNTLSNGGGSWSITGAGIAVISQTAGAITVTATEVDGSVTNELQTFSNSSNATSHTLTLSNLGGSIQFVEGSNVTITTTGTASDAIVTIAASGGGGSTNYQTWYDDGVAATQRANANFVSNSDIAFTLTDDGVNIETEVTADIPAAAVDFSEIQNVGTGTLAGRSTTGSGSLEQITVSTGLTISGGNLTANDASTTNELQTYSHAGTTTYTNTLSNGGGSWSITGAGIAVISQTAGAITVTATEVDGSVTNELQTYSHAGTTTYTNTLSNGGGSWSITGAGIAVISQTAGAVTVTATEVDGSVTNELQTYSHAGTTSYTNTLSNGGGSFTINAGGINTISHTAGTLTITATEVDGSVTNEGQLGVGAGGASSSVLTSNTSGATGVTINVAGINTISETTSANGGQITITATEVDGSVTNELQTYSHAGTTTYTNTLSNGGGSWSITGAGIAVISQTAGAVTVTATEVDGSVTNEGQLGVGAGGASSSVLTSNTSGATGVTINVAGINTISETTSANGGQITITATEVDGSVTNELQTINNTSNATSHTVTLSNSGGSIQFVEGTNITLTTTGTAADAVVTISSTASGGTGDINQNGNSFGAAFVIGTNDNNTVSLEQNGTTAFTLGTDKNLTLTNTVAATATVTDRLIVQTNSTTSAANNFGTGILFQAESSTTDNRDLVGLRGYWTASTDATRTSAFGISLSQNGGALTETFKFDRTVDADGALTIGTTSGVQIYNDGIWPNVTTFKIGSTANVEIGASTGGVILVRETSTTSSTLDIGIEARSTGTPAAGFGPNLDFMGESSTTVGRVQGSIRTVWTTATDASRTADMIFSTVNNAAAPAEAMRITGAGQVQTTNTLRIGAVTGTPTTLIGRDGTGQVGTVAIGSGLSLSGGTLSATGGGGTPAGANFQVQYFNSGAFGAEAEFNYDPTNNQLVVGTTTAAAAIHGRGRNDTGVNVFLAENFSGNDIFAVKSNGIVKLGDSETYPIFKQTATAGGAVSYTETGITFESSPSLTTTDVFSFFHPSVSLSSGTYNITRHTGTWAVATGTAAYNSVTIDPTINVNTTASGNVQMLKIAPTITQANGGANMLSITPTITASTGVENMINVNPSITSSSGGLRGVYTNIASGTGFYQIFADGTAISRFDGEVGIKTDPASGFDLHVVGNQRNDARISIRGTGIPASSSAAAGVAMTNTTTGTGDTWFIGSINDGTFVLQSANASTVLTGQTDGKISTTYGLQIGDVAGFIPTTVIGRDASGNVGTVTLGTNVTLASGELPLWNSNDATSITSLTSTALADVTGLSFAVTANRRYEFRAVIKYSSASIATGSAWSINGPAGTVQLHVMSGLTTTTTFDHWQNAVNTLLASASSVYTTGNIAIITGIVEPTASGTYIIRGATETNGSVITVQGTSNINWREIK